MLEPGPVGLISALSIHYKPYGRRNFLKGIEGRGLRRQVLNSSLVMLTKVIMEQLFGSLFSTVNGCGNADSVIGIAGQL